MEYMEDKHLELYNLRDDVGERSDWTGRLRRRNATEGVPYSPCHGLPESRTVI